MKQIFFNKALIVVLVLCFFSKFNFAQSYSTTPSSVFSFDIGFTSSNLINPRAAVKPGILFSGGFSYSVMLNKHLNIGLDLLYTGKAFKSESPVIKYRCYFVDVPLYAQLKFGEKFRIDLGAQYSIATNSQVVVLDPNNNNGVDVQNTGNIRGSDYGFLLGAEMDLGKQITLAARYTISGSAFFGGSDFNFGVFMLSFKYSPIKTYKEFFHKTAE